MLVSLKSKAILHPYDTSKLFSSATQKRTARVYIFVSLTVMTNFFEHIHKKMIKGLHHLKLGTPVNTNRYQTWAYLPASTVWRVEDFIIENWKIKGQSQTNGVRWREFNHGNVASSFVRYQTVLCCLLPVIACGKLCQVPVVISLPEQREQQTYVTNTCDSKRV